MELTEEGYVQPEQFFFGVTISVLISLIANAASKARQTEGRQTMFGTPRNDVERLMSHYGLTEAEARGLLTRYSVDELLPLRGYRRLVSPTGGQQPMLGTPRNDVERLMSHYGLTEDEACELLAMYSVDELLPPRGYGQSPAPFEIVGHSQSELVRALTLMESSIEFGDKARITFCTETLPTEEDLAAMHLNLLDMGCHLSRPTARIVGGIPTTEFVLKKGSPVWAAILPLIVPVLILGLITFGIFRLDTITKALMPIILVAGGLTIVLAVLAQKPATAYVERGGKVPYLPATNSGSSELEEKARSLWTKACQAEGIPVESKFVVFSDDNPYIKAYNEAVGQLQRMRQFKGGRWQPAVIKSKKVMAAR